MVSITLKGRKIPLVYTVWEMKTIQEEIATNDRMMALITGKNPEDETDNSLYGGPEHLNVIAKLIRILGNAGLEEAGEVPDLTDKKVLRAMKPMQLVDAVNACIDAMNDGFQSEIPEKKDEGPVDVTLEEMKKKETKDD